MDLFQVIILGIVQGITEFLPISSSAHLILVSLLTNWQDQGVIFDISTHMGTLFAVMVYFRHEVLNLIKGTLDLFKLSYKTTNALLVIFLTISTIPLIIVGILEKDHIHEVRSAVVIGIASIFFGILLEVSDRYAQKKNKNKEVRNGIEDIGLKEAIIFGLFQALSLLPGTSRSGICMTAGRFLGFSRDTATRYAILMAIPAILAVTGGTLIDDFETNVNWSNGLLDLFIGMTISFLSAMLGLRLLMELVKRVGFLPFVIYRVLLGIALLALHYAGYNGI